MRGLFDKLSQSRSSSKNRESKKRRLKVCMVYYQYFGALIYREAKALKENGFEIDIVCLKDPSEKGFVHKFDGLNLYKLQARPSAEKTQALYFLNLGLFFIKALMFLTFQAVLKRYSLIHVTSPPDAMVFAAFVPKMLGAKVLLDIHDIGPELYMRKTGFQEHHIVVDLLKSLEKVSGLFSDHVITVTKLWREKLIERSVSPMKCSVLLNVPDEDIFNTNDTKKLSRRNSREFNLYYHGSLEEHFGVDTLLQAMPTVRKHIPNVSLNIYSGKKGRLYDDFILSTKEMEMEEYVRFYDYVPFYELPQILKNADLGIVPTKGSIFSDEALSMKSLEYIFLQIPIVISQTKAHRFYYSSEMVEFFEPGNHYDLARAIISMYMDPKKKIRLRCNSEDFINEYSWNSKTRKIYLDIINRLVSN